MKYDNETKENLALEREVFWTGGWDSTFRLVQLSRSFAGKVQPTYILEENRKSNNIELERMNEIYNLLINHPETIATILPLKIINKDDIPEIIDITEAYNKLCEKVRIGSQYEYLARYAAMNPYVEIGPECPDGEYSGIVDGITRYGKLKHDGGDSWILDLDKSTKECCLLFGNFSYPIIKTTEREMLSMIKQWKYEGIMSHIWFCHSPIDGEPCGICRPCEQKMEEHMEFLLPTSAQRRYRISKIIIKVFGNRGRSLCRKIMLFNRKNAVFKN